MKFVVLELTNIPCPIGEIVNTEAVIPFKLTIFLRVDGNSGGLPGRDAHECAEWVCPVPPQLPASTEPEIKAVTNTITVLVAAWEDFI